MQKEGIVGLALGGDAVVVKARVGTRGRVPALGVRRVGDDGVHIERVVRLGVALLEIGPVVGKCVAVAREDVVGLDASHDKVHAREIVGVLLKLLGVVLDAAGIARTLGHGGADVDEQRARAARGVVNLNLAAVLQVLGHNLGHEDGHLVRRVELPCLLARVGGKVGNEVLVDVAEHVVTLPAVHRDVLYKAQKPADGLGTRTRGVTQLGQARLQRLENVVEDIAVVGINQAAKGRECLGHVGDVEVGALG